MHSSSCLLTDPSLETWVLREKIFCTSLDLPLMVPLCCWPDQTCKPSRDSSEMSLWPAPVPAARAVSPRPSFPPIHLWITVCTSSTVFPGSPANFHNPLPPSPPRPTSFTCPPNQSIPMLIALSKLTFPNGKRSSESFKGKIGIHETYHENLGLKKRKKNLILILPVEIVSTGGLLCIVFPTEASFSSVPTVS